MSAPIGIRNALQKLKGIQVCAKNGGTFKVLCVKSRHSKTTDSLRNLVARYSDHP